MARIRTAPVTRKTCTSTRPPMPSIPGMAATRVVHPVRPMSPSRHRARTRIAACRRARDPRVSPAEAPGIRASTTARGCAPRTRRPAPAARGRAKEAGRVRRVPAAPARAWPTPVSSATISRCPLASVPLRRAPRDRVRDPRGSTVGRPTAVGGVRVNGSQLAARAGPLQGTGPLPRRRDSLMAPASRLTVLASTGLASTGGLVSGAAITTGLARANPVRTARVSAGLASAAPVGGRVLSSTARGWPTTGRARRCQAGRNLASAARAREGRLRGAQERVTMAREPVSPIPGWGHTARGRAHTGRAWALVDLA
jgi:hypothetical protein